MRRPRPPRRDRRAAEPAPRAHAEHRPSKGGRQCGRQGRRGRVGMHVGNRPWGHRAVEPGHAHGRRRSQQESAQGPTRAWRTTRWRSTARSSWETPPPEQASVEMAKAVAGHERRSASQRDGGSRRAWAPREDGKNGPLGGARSTGRHPYGRARRTDGRQDGQPPRHPHDRREQRKRRNACRRGPSEWEAPKRHAPSRKRPYRPRTHGLSCHPTYPDPPSDSRSCTKCLFPYRTDDAPRFVTPPPSRA